MRQPDMREVKDAIVLAACKTPDRLGRVQIPISVRNKLGIDSETFLDFYVDQSQGIIIIAKHQGASVEVA